MVDTKPRRNANWDDTDAAGPADPRGGKQDRQQCLGLYAALSIRGFGVRSGRERRTMAAGDCINIALQVPHRRYFAAVDASIR